MKFSSLQLSQQQGGPRVHRESPEFKTSTTALAHRIVRSCTDDELFVSYPMLRASEEKPMNPRIFNLFPLSSTVDNPGDDNPGDTILVTDGTITACEKAMLR
jgi:hypothetical protein